MWECERLAFKKTLRKKRVSISDLNFPIDFILITVNSIYACTLVIAAQQEEIFWIFDFVGEKQANCLEWLLSWKKMIEKQVQGWKKRERVSFSTTFQNLKLLTSINIIAEKEIVGLWRESAILKQSQQVWILSVNVSANLQRRFQFQQNRLLEENFAGLQAESADLLLGHANGPVGFGAYWGWVERWHY